MTAALRTWRELTHNVNGTVVHYAHTGSTTQPVLVLLHGFRSNRHGLDALTEQLRGYQVFAPDIPGFGQTEPVSPPITLERQSAVLTAFIEQVVAGPFTLIGHSLGASIALLMAGSFGAELQSVVLISPVTKPTRLLSVFIHIYFRMALLLPDKIKQMWFGNKTMVWLVDRWMFRTGTKHAQNRIISQDWSNINENRPEILIRTTLSYESTRFERAAKQILMPVYCIGGDSDPLVPVRKLRRVARTIPHAKLELLPGRGHLFPVEEPQYAGKLIRTWFEAQD